MDLMSLVNSPILLLLWLSCSKRGSGRSSFVAGLQGKPIIEDSADLRVGAEAVSSSNKRTKNTASS